VKPLAQSVCDAAESIAMAARLTRDLPAYLRAPLTAAQARRQVLQQIDTRAQGFLDLMDRAVFGYDRSPYRKLLAHAGCERGDLHRLVAQEGLEGALRQLAGQGVYVSFDEFKGRRPAVRGSARFTFSDRDFDSPLGRWHYFELTGGSRGRPIRVGRTLDLVTEVSAMFGLVLEAHGIRNPRNVFWFGASPTWSLVHTKLGHSVDAWFQLVRPLPIELRLALRYLRLLAGLSGHHVPAPRYCDLNEPETIVRWLIEHAGDGRPTLVNSTVSSAARIASAAASRGVALEGVTFHCRSEPLSASRRRHLEATGAQALTDYASVELNTIAFACPAGTAADDVHLSLNRLALVERARPIFETGPTVQALLFTTLSLTAPKIALNVELGDSARVEERECGCPLSALGLRTHLSEIRSFEKLSSEGTTFARGNMIQILEEILPARFGGTPVDYQLVEEEAPAGLTRLLLRVHPHVGPIDEEAVRSAMLDEMSRGGYVDRNQARIIGLARSIEVRRLVPLATRAGKVLPYHLLRHADSARGES
jgi:hypothetical protein